MSDENQRFIKAAAGSALFTGLLWYFILPGAAWWLMLAIWAATTGAVSQDMLKEKALKKMAGE